MPRKPSQSLTDGELRLMNVLWQRGPSTVLEIQSDLEDDLVDSTIRTLLRILEDKGYVRRSKDGRAFLYHPVVHLEDSQANAVEQVVTKFFGSRANLVLNLLDSGELDADELAEIKRVVERRRKERGG